MSKNPKCAVVIVAGGSGARMGADVPKQYLEIEEKTILRHTIDAFAGYDVQVVIGKEDRDLYDKSVVGLNLSEPVIGGATRQESVFNGLQALAKERLDYVLIHDAARPFVCKALIERVVEKLQAGAQAVVPVIAINDTVKQHRGGVITQTVDRNSIAAVQTPQGFVFQTIYDLHQRAQGMEFTDDAGICEDFGIQVHLVDGDIKNQKITTEDDLKSNCEKEKAMDIRVGSGFDVHAFEEGDAVTLCGVAVPHSHKLQGHSDADVALHAIVDALLGAAALGDIGKHFPPSDPQWKGKNSQKFVEHAHTLVREKGGRVNHIDVTIICEKPKLAAFIEPMRVNVAAMLGMPLDKVSVKATTTEKLGFTGREEGIAGQATATVIF